MSHYIDAIVIPVPRANLDTYVGSTSVLRRLQRMGGALTRGKRYQRQDHRVGMAVPMLAVLSLALAAA